MDVAIYRPRLEPGLEVWTGILGCCVAKLGYVDVFGRRVSIVYVEEPI